MQTVFGHLQSRSDRFGDVYTEGFSQNSMWAALAGFCFDTQVKGVWQGGSGLALVGQLLTYVTFRLNFHRFDLFELDLRGHIHVLGRCHPQQRIT